MAGTFNPEGFGIAKQVFTLGGDTEPMIITHGFENVGDLDPDACAVLVKDAWEDSFVPAMLSSAWTWVGTEVQLGNPTGSGGPVGSFTLAVPGTASQAAMPQNVAMLVHKRTAIGGRRGRGRFYLPGGYLQENAVDPAGNVLASLITSVNAVLADYLATLDTNAVPMVLLHVQAAPVVPPYPVTLLAVDPVIATQRQRLRR